MAPNDFNKLLEKYLAGKCTEDEREIINAWYSALGGKPYPKEDAVPEGRLRDIESRILSKVGAHVALSPPDPVHGEEKRSFFWRYMGIAASVLLCLASGAYYLLPSATPGVLAVNEFSAVAPTDVVENNSTESKRVVLRDGSIVEMSPGSRIRFSDESDASVRELFLEGEAYFDVAHNSDRPFLVYAGNVVTKVLGTTFVVSALGQDEKVTVSVRTGKVTVYSRNSSHKKTVLVPNQEAVYNKVTDVLATQPVTVMGPSAPYSKITEMHFEETPVSAVLEMLNETYDIDISFHKETLSGCVLTSSFYEEGLYDRIDVICTAIGATYEIVDSRIVINSPGCNLKTE